MKNIDSIKNIRSNILNKNNPINDGPGIYRWWFIEDVALRIIKQLYNTNFELNMIEKRVIDGKTYMALYFGISKNLKKRIEWHVCQHHTASAVNSGFLSTLRQTLSSLLHKNMTESEDCLNKFMDENCYWEWDYTETHKEAMEIEKQELASSSHYYPLNISNNKSLPKEITKRVKDLRKEYKK